MPYYGDLIQNYVRRSTFWE